LCASESTSEFERLARDYNTVRGKMEFGALHHSRDRIRIHDLMNSVRLSLSSAINKAALVVLLQKNSDASWFNKRDKRWL
jgi:hypothetical protein